MPEGTLEVLVVNARSLHNADYLKNMDPYVILTCRTQEQRSSVASGMGSDPEWNENFNFTISEGVSELNLKILDSDMAGDDLVGKVTIPLEPVFEKGSLPEMAYNVVKGEEYCGEIKLGLSFTPLAHSSRGYTFSRQEY